MDSIKRAFKAEPADQTGQVQGSMVPRQAPVQDKHDHTLKDVKDMQDIQQRDDITPDKQQELAQLRNQLQNSGNIQSSRMQHHAFEPLSLPGSQPVSRVSTHLIYLDFPSCVI